MVKKIFIGLLIIAITLNLFFITTPNKANALSNEYEYYDKYKLEKIYNEEETFTLTIRLNGLQTRPIVQNDPYIMNFNLDYEIILEAYYTFEDTFLYLNIFYTRVRGTGTIQTNYGGSGKLQTRYFEFDTNPEQRPLENEHQLLINDSYNLYDGTAIYFNENQSLIQTYIRLESNYLEQSDEYITSIQMEPIYITTQDDYYFGLIEINKNQGVIDGTSSTIPVNLYSFEQDITYATPIMQYKQMYEYKNDFTNDENFSESYDNVMSSVFNGFGNILNTQIFPGITIGLIIGLPILLGLFLIILKLIRG